MLRIVPVVPATKGIQAIEFTHPAIVSAPKELRAMYPASMARVLEHVCDRADFAKLEVEIRADKLIIKTFGSGNPINIHHLLDSELLRHCRANDDGSIGLEKMQREPMEQGSRPHARWGDQKTGASQYRSANRQHRAAA